MAVFRGRNIESQHGHVTPLTLTTLIGAQRDAGVEAFYLCNMRGKPLAGGPREPDRVCSSTTKLVVLSSGTKSLLRFWRVTAFHE
jgi:hypothetical protein